MKHVIRSNPKPSFSYEYNVNNLFSIRITGFQLELNSADEILKYLKTTKEAILKNAGSAWLAHPLDIHSLTSANLKYYYLEPSKKLNRIFAENANIEQQIQYLSLMGINDAIARHESLGEAVKFHRFNTSLASLKIINPSIELDDNEKFIEPIRRIHALHPMFLKDEEIATGLQISQKKNTSEDKVLFVCSLESLKLALKHCAPNTTLIIDGHWLHGKKNFHGVWEAADAQQIAKNLGDLLSKYPKINSIRLLGCEAGYLAPIEDLSGIIHRNSFFFKSNLDPGFAKRPMHRFRNRSVYLSKNGEHPFASSSLAGRIIEHLPDSPIKISACHSRTYPYPPSNSEYNIGSDSQRWGSTHYWQSPNQEWPEWYVNLHQLKSITFIKETEKNDVGEPHWMKFDSNDKINC